ncbi:type I restriction enzyme HsdR N-terminal domain-containing protein [Elizabethkingia anophelis]|uniref:Restriction endonuclease n=1 Tax=Elizabethkingia miricola TaxID=172045 RepID=A0ABD4DT29_ELIMR|nr:MULTISPECIES: type I restriction endonuclease [Elizabethkingia]MCT3835039.1 type I restriction enzyme HsdR N-terminal domain-containing protein [Elizabethkingia anophelis]KUY21409.1 restriction endonuclease [Elizabethkingia miricola]MCL1651577.1 type I restriction endonuclease [Elizabethkingia miricola]MCP1250945.1 type I restriction endonuclease [Elizabethkingia sp. S0634]MCT3921048.1 type I restriction enzyme HsdR N-terminal domain-containing protein [Elizabethkingia anophelis]
MELKLKLEQLSQRIQGLKEQVQTEEATKNAFVMPFIQMLGYDIFNPTEVIPEYIADIGTKKGEKVDYLIKNNQEPILIIECKNWKENADAHNSQLHRYYHVSKARFGVLTNGIVYNFYTDLEKPNIMDDKPFLTINLEDLKDSAIKVLESFNKQSYNLESILDSAEALKYIRAIRKEFEKEIENPSDELVRLLVNKFFERPLTANRMQSFKEYTKRALSISITESISSRLKSALVINERLDTNTPKPVAVDEHSETSKVVTTEEELEAFQIVKAILREKLPAERIAHRDTQSYFGVLLDDNNRKPVCRFHFGTSRKQIELFHNGKDAGERMLLESLEDIYKHRDLLHQTLENYTV